MMNTQTCLCRANESTRQSKGRGPCSCVRLMLKGYTVAGQAAFLSSQFAQENKIMTGMTKEWWFLRKCVQKHCVHAALLSGFGSKLFSPELEQRCEAVVC